MILAAKFIAGVIAYFWLAELTLWLLSQPSTLANTTGVVLGLALLIGAVHLTEKGFTWLESHWG